MAKVTSSSAAASDTVSPLEQRLDLLLESINQRITTGDASLTGEVPAAASSPRRVAFASQRNLQDRTKSMEKRHTHHGNDEDDEAAFSAANSVDSGPVLFEESPPFIKNGKMRDYQVRGLNFMVECLHKTLNPILADEMGLGKTLQTISLFGYYVEVMKTRKPFLVIAPKSTLHNWMAEIAKWCPSLHALCLIGSKDERPEIIKAWFLANNPEGLRNYRGKTKKTTAASDEEEKDEEDEEIELENEDEADDVGKAPSALSTAEVIAAAKLNKDNKPYHVLVTSYEMCLNEKSFIKKQPWSILVIDEAHRIKNEQSKLSEAVRLFKTDHRVLLTGTPLQNNLRELWALLNFLKPELFVSAEEFEQYFNLTSDKQDYLIKKLHAVLRPFMLRRLKSEVEKRLPPKKEVRVFVPMCDLQRKMYKQMLIDKHMFWHPNADKDSGKTSRKIFNNIIMQLRKVCNHPYIFDGIDPSPINVDPADDDLQHVVGACGKLEFIDKLLTRLKKDGHRVLLFSQMTRMLDILDDYCRWRKYEYCRIDGDTDHVLRQEQIEDFNSPDSKKFLFLLSTRAGGLGINLATADVVIIYDSDWNPQVDLQAIDRAHRIGQTKQVRVFRLVTDGSIEEGIIKRAEMKRRLDHVVIQQGRLAQAQAAAASKDELREILRASAASTLTDEANSAEMNIDAILAKSEARTVELDKKLTQMGEAQLEKFSLDIDDTRLNAYNFEGTDFKASRIRQQLAGGSYDDGGISDAMVADIVTKIRYGDQYGADGIRECRKRRPVGTLLNEWQRDELLQAELVRQQARRVAPNLTPVDIAYNAYVARCRERGGPFIMRLRQKHFMPFQFPPKRLLELYEDEKKFYYKTIGYKPEFKFDADATSKPNVDGGDAKADDDVVEIDAEGDVVVENAGDEPFKIAGERKRTRTADSATDGSGPNKRKAGNSLTEQDAKAQHERALRSIDAAQPLTADEEDELTELIRQCFDDWGKKDVLNYVRAMERAGVEDVAMIARFMQDRDEADVRRYHKVFWQRHEELDDDDRLMKIVRRGEEQRKLVKEKQDLLDKKISSYVYPEVELSVQYAGPKAASKSKIFSESDDRLLLILLHQIRLGTPLAYCELKKRLLMHPLARFNFLLPMRTEQELQKRVDMLLRMIKKEFDSLAASTAKLVNAASNNNPNGGVVASKTSSNGNSTAVAKVAKKKKQNPASSMDENAIKPPASLLIAINGNNTGNKKNSKFFD